MRLTSKHDEVLGFFAEKKRLFLKFTSKTSVRLFKFSREKENWPYMSP